MRVMILPFSEKRLPIMHFRDEERDSGKQLAESHPANEWHRWESQPLPFHLEGRGQVGFIHFQGLRSLGV